MNTIENTVAILTHTKRSIYENDRLFFCSDHGLKATTSISSLGIIQIYNIFFLYYLKVSVKINNYGGSIVFVFIIKPYVFKRYKALLEPCNIMYKSCILNQETVI